MQPWKMEDQWKDLSATTFSEAPLQAAPGFPSQGLRSSDYPPFPPVARDSRGRSRAPYTLLINDQFQPVVGQMNTCRQGRFHIGMLDIVSDMGEVGGGGPNA